MRARRVAILATSLLALAASSRAAHAQTQDENGGTPFRRIEVVPLIGLVNGVGDDSDAIQFGVRLGLYRGSWITPTIAVETWDLVDSCDDPERTCVFETRLLTAGAEARIPHWKLPHLRLGAEAGLYDGDGGSALTAGVHADYEVPIFATFALRFGWRYQWVFGGGPEVRGITVGGRFRVPAPSVLR